MARLRLGRLGALVLSLTSAAMSWGCGGDAGGDGVRFAPPLHVHFRHEDVHVIAFLEDHPEYEAVEAMIGLRAGREPLVRAILTRHDKTQVDHINDEVVVADRRRRNPERATQLTAIDLLLERSGDLPGVRLAFPSFAGERVVFDLHSASPSLAEFGGLTDPLGHAGTSTLPVMWREASAIASPATRVEIDGQRYAVPVRFPGPGFVGLDAYYTDGFVIGVIPAGSVELVVKHVARRIEVGEEWRFARPGLPPLVYRVTARSGEEVVIEEVSEGLETLFGLAAEGELRLARLEYRASSETPGVLRVDFDPPISALPEAALRARFRIAIDDHPDLVTGAAVQGDGGLLLIPERPEWATERVVRVAVSRAGGRYVLQQTIEGAAAAPSASPR